jgi:hypothetical protein
MFMVGGLGFKGLDKRMVRGPTVRVYGAKSVVNDILGLDRNAGDLGFKISFMFSLEFWARGF